MSKVRAWLEAALPWGILGLMGLGLLGGQVSESIEHLVQQNGAVLLLVAIIIQQVPRLIDAQKQEAVALADLSAAVRQVAAKDNYHEREILGALRVLAEEVREVKARVQSPRSEVQSPPTSDGERRTGDGSHTRW